MSELSAAVTGIASRMIEAEDGLATMLYGAMKPEDESARKHMKKSRHTRADDSELKALHRGTPEYEAFRRGLEERRALARPNGDLPSEAAVGTCAESIFYDMKKTPEEKIRELQAMLPDPAAQAYLDSLGRMRLLASVPGAGLRVLAREGDHRFAIGPVGGDGSSARIFDTETKTTSETKPLTEILASGAWDPPRGDEDPVAILSAMQ